MKNRISNFVDEKGTLGSEKIVGNPPATDIAYSSSSALYETPPTNVDEALKGMEGAVGTNITQAVEDWLDENITEPTDPVIDASLTVANAAADAKATGDKIDGLKSALNAVINDEYAPLLFTMESGYIKVSDGGIGSSTTSFHTDYIDVSGFTKIKFKRRGITSTSANGGMCFYDNTKSFISGTSIPDKTSQPANAYLADLCETTVPDNAVYARFTTFGDTTTYGDFAVYGYSKLNETVQILDDFAGDVGEYVQPTNLFNKDSALIKANYRLSSSGDYISLSGSSVTHPIPIVVGQEYSFSFSGSYYGDAANKIVRYCTADGTLVGDGQNATVNTDSGGTKYGTFTAIDKGIDAHFVCVNIRSTLLSSMMFVKGGTIPVYSAWFEPYWTIKLPNAAQINMLYGKKAAFTGDSICYGAGYSGGYPKIIGNNNNMTISNTGQTGATLASGTTVDGVNRGWICNKVANMPADYDYYIVEGGVNDAAGDVGVQLGALSNGYTATLDTTTLYGAVESICKTLQTTFVGKKYGFLIPHNTYAWTHRWNTDFRPAIKEACAKWGIPVLDLSEETAQLYNISALKTYTLNSDGWHPTEDGYKIYYVPKIEAWMKTL